MPKKDIQPKYFEEAKFTCTTCSNKFICGTTRKEEVRVDVCSNCHPFYSGATNFANTTGRVEQFKSKFARKDEINTSVQEASKKQKQENKSKDKK
ncbi:50S ribosomal protein L31 [Entomoplasma ellychniae]|uniref:50S ribosomal protein L31 n=1 Tax=Entomoplasma ellychniae TaxID=2114 RepID=A0A8E2QZK7_9MOLU|nr:50S ribosomal protein L31 [Entomoplasma ellychniae]PPE04765.1 50S ribosomal protein L31 [Entomoplasma ellychniae]